MDVIDEEVSNTTSVYEKVSSHRAKASSTDMRARMSEKWHPEI